MARGGIIPKEKRTVFGSGGRADLGMVTAEMARAGGFRSGPVRLLNGVESRSSGFGLEHILAKPGRLQQIERFGFREVVSYVQHVASRFDILALADDGKIILQMDFAGCSHELVCHWDETLALWSVTTIIPKRISRNLAIVWKR